MEKDNMFLARNEAVEQLKELMGLKDCVMNNALQHAVHWFKGYRDEMLGKDGNIYIPGSARDISYRSGVQQARLDRKENL